MGKIINTMYGGEVELIFDNLAHRYSIDGKIIKSVTAINDIMSKPWLTPWAAKITVERMAELIKPGVAYDEIQIINMLNEAKKAHYAAKTEAADIGTLVHKYLEQYIKGENPTELIHEEAQKATKRFRDWVEKHKVKFLLSEQMVYSRKYNYCGTLDFVCVLDGKLMLGDIKTSNQISKREYGAQMAAYTLARQEEFPKEKYEGCILIRVGKKEGEFEPWCLLKPEVDKYKKVFIDALNLTRSCEEADEYSKSL